MDTEQKLYCDIVQFDFEDHYNNITLKSVHIVKYLLDHPTLSKSLKYVLMTDDDSFVNVPKLYEELFIKQVSTTPMSTFYHEISFFHEEQRHSYI